MLGKIAQLGAKAKPAVGIALTVIDIAMYANKMIKVHKTSGSPYRAMIQKELKRGKRR